MQVVRQHGNALFQKRTIRSSFVASTPCAAIFSQVCIRSRPSFPPAPRYETVRNASGNRWTARQARDQFAREARVQGLKSRAAFKLLQINDKYRLFKKGQTVVDLGYAPGSWSQVAIASTSPHGRVLGIDLIPAQPPKGVSTIQGDFLSAEVRADVKSFLRDSQHGRMRRQARVISSAEDEAELARSEYEDTENETPAATEVEASAGSEGETVSSTGSESILASESYIDRERRESSSSSELVGVRTLEVKETGEKEQNKEDRMVDVVLSDMCEPWEQTSGFYKRSISNPYRRLMNTSGNNFRDHAGSMDLCRAALEFAYDVLKPGGHFVCKFYQGAEDKALEMQLKKLFAKVHREKPESSRSESKESYFVGIRRLGNAKREEVLSEG